MLSSYAGFVCLLALVPVSVVHSDSVYPSEEDYGLWPRSSEVILVENI